MTSKEKIEELLNLYGDTLNNMPIPTEVAYAYTCEDRQYAKKRVAEWGTRDPHNTTRSDDLLDFICHQSDVIEKLIKALETTKQNIIRCKDCKRYEPASDCAGQCSYWCRGTQSDMYCSRAEKKTVRGNRANWIGYGTDQGILWVNPIDKKEEFERYEESNSNT